MLQPVHQQLDLSLDIAGERILGSTSIVYVPDDDPREIGLNADASQLQVAKVWVDGVEAEFEQHQTKGFRSPGRTADGIGFSPALASVQEMLRKHVGKDVKVDHHKEAQRLERRREHFLGAKNYFCLDEIRFGGQFHKVRHLDVAKARAAERASASEKGELLIKVPRKVLHQREEQRKKRSEDSGEFSLMEDTTEASNEAIPLTVKIMYAVAGARTGIHFVTSRRGAYANRPKHVFSYTSRGRPSSWFPCNESYDAMCTFDLRFACPESMTVIATGDLVQQEQISKTTTQFRFSVSRAILARGIGFACGPFGEKITLTPPEGIRETVAIEIYVPAAATHIEQARLKRKNLLKRAREQSQTTCSCLYQILESYSKFLNRLDFPFKAYKQIFVHEACVPIDAYAGMAICHVDNLHDRDVIDQVYCSRKLLARAAAEAWVRHITWVSGLQDEWIASGIVAVLVDRYIRESLGNNEASCESRHYAEQLCSMEDPDYKPVVVKSPESAGLGSGAAPAGYGGHDQQVEVIETTHPNLPLSYDGFLYPGEACLQSREDKAALVMLALQEMIGKSFKDLLRDWINKRASPLSYMKKAAKTSSFIKLCRKARSSPDEDAEVVQYAKHFINGIKCPRLHVRYGYNKKERKTHLEIVQDLRVPAEVMSGMMMGGHIVQRQVNPSPKKIQRRNTSPSKHRSPGRPSPRPGLPMRKLDGKTSPKPGGGSGVRFSGYLTFEIKELNRQIVRRVMVDGMQDSKQVQKYQCSSSKPRNQKRKRVDEASITLDELLRRRIENPVCWIKADPERFWIRPVQVTQDEVMWIYMLRGDTDVLAQLDAVEGLRRLGLQMHVVDPLLSPKALEEVVKNRDYYYQVRIAAAKALAFYASRARHGKDEAETRMRQDAESNGEWKAGEEKPPMLAYRALNDYLKIHYYDSGNQIWRSNNFSDFADYFLKRGVIRAVATIQDNESLSPTKVVDCLVSLLKDNDNGRNAYSDCYYLHDLILCLGQIRLSKTESPEKIWDQISRYLEYDRVLPSYRNLISTAALRATCELMVADVLPRDKLRFKDFTTYLNYDKVRLTALQCMVRLIVKDPASAPEVLMTICDEVCPGVQRSALRYWTQYWERQPPVVRRFTDRDSSVPSSVKTRLRDRVWLLLMDHPDGVMRYTAERLYYAIWRKGPRSQIDKQIFLLAQSNPVPSAMRRWHEAKMSLQKWKADRTKNTGYDGRLSGTVIKINPGGKERVSLKMSGIRK